MKTHRIAVAAALLALLFAVPAQAVEVYVNSSSASERAPFTARLVALVMPPETNVVKYEWDFDGDGNTDQETNVPETTHAYAAPGKYNTSVKITDASGNTYTGVTQVLGLPLP